MFLCTFAVLVAGGCDLLSLDEEDVEEVHFVAHFTEDWLPEDAEGFIVISDLKGKALASATWTGNERIGFKLELEKGDKPARLIVTTGVRYPYYGQVYLTSNCNVLPGDWTWRGKPQLEYEGDATLQFSNPPSGGGWYRVSGLNYSTSGDLPVQIHIHRLYVTQDDLCFMLYPDEGATRSLWINAIRPWETRTVDLNNLEPAVEEVVQLPRTSSHFLIDFRGYPTLGKYYQGAYYLDSHEMWGEESLFDFGFTHPQEMTAFRTLIVLFDSPDHWDGDYWYYARYGAAPSSTTTINADFAIESSRADNFEIDITGRVDNVLSNWSGRYQYDGMRWQVYTHPDYIRFALPEMPDHIRDEFNLPYAIQFVLDDVQIMDYPDLDSHEEVIETLFQSDDYFFNIASSGVLIRTRQNGGLAKDNNRTAGAPHRWNRADPMIPIP
jgi:hypothetical protein